MRHFYLRLDEYNNIFIENKLNRKRDKKTKTYAQKLVLCWIIRLKSNIELRWARMSLTFFFRKIYVSRWNVFLNSVGRSSVFANYSLFFTFAKFDVMRPELYISRCFMSHYCCMKCDRKLILKLIRFLTLAAVISEASWGRVLCRKQSVKVPINQGGNFMQLAEQNANEKQSVLHGIQWAT